MEPRGWEVTMSLKVSGLEASSARRAWSGSERNVSGFAAVFKEGVAFAEGPGEGGAVGDRPLEAVGVCGCGVGFGGGAVRIEDEQDAVVVFASEFANHQRTGAS